MKKEHGIYTILSKKEVKGRPVSFEKTDKKINSALLVIVKKSLTC
jgi:hypothetical protein